MPVKKYDWIGGKITNEQMHYLYSLKKKLHRPITKLIKEAVDLLIEKYKKEGGIKDENGINKEDTDKEDTDKTNTERGTF